MPWLLGSAMLWFAGFALLVPVAPLWVIRGGSDDLGAGLVTGIMMACTVLAQLSMRRVLAGLGWRWTLVLGAGLLGLPALGHLATDRLWAVTALAALRGLGFGIVTVCGATAVASFVEPGRRGRALGALGLAIAAPQFILVPVAPWLADRAGFGLVFVLAVLPALAIPLAWPIARAVGDRDRAPAGGSGAGGSGPGAAALGRVLLGPIAALVVITASGGAILTFTPRILVSPALGFAGLLAFTGAAAVSRWGAGGVGDRFGATTAIAPLLFTGALGLAGIALRADSVHDNAGRVLVISGLLLVGFAYGGLQNLTLTQAFAAAGEPARNSVSIAWNLSFDAGTGLGAFAVGAIATATSYSVAFAVLALAVGFTGGGWGWSRLARRWLPGPGAAVRASVVTVPISGATATVVPVLIAAAAVLLVVAAGEQDRPDAGDRPGPRLGQQGGGRRLGVLAVPGHPGRDEPGHDRRGEGRPAPLRHARELPPLPREGGDVAGERAGGERVDQVLAGRVHVHPAAEVAEVRAAAPVGPERPDRDHSRERGRPLRQRALAVPRRGDTGDALVPAQVFQPDLEGHQRNIEPGRRRDRHVEYLGAVGEPLVQLRDEIRFQRAARDVEDAPDHDVRAGRHAADDPRDERAVPPVRQDRAVGKDRRVVVPLHMLQPRAAGHGVPDDPGVRHVNPHAMAGVSRADRRIGFRVVHLLGFGGRTARRMPLRGGHHVIQRRESRAEFVFDASEQEMRVALVTLRAIGAQVDGDDAPGDLPDLDIPDFVLPEYVQHASLPVGVLDPLEAADPLYPAEVLLAGQDPVPGVHIGDAAVLGGYADDIDVALGECVDDDGRLVTVPCVCQSLMPGHCASPENGSLGFRGTARGRILYGAAGPPV
jgi:hypothetical protein